MAKKSIEQQRKELEEIRAKRIAAEARLAAQLARTAEVERQLAEVNAANSRVSEQRKQELARIKSLEARIKATEAETRRIDKTLAAEDRRADRTTATRRAARTPTTPRTKASTKKGGMALAQFNERIDSQGRFFGPLIERNAEGGIVSVPVPSADDLRGFNTKDPAHVEQMSRLLGRFGFPAPDKMIAQQEKYLADFDVLPTLPDGLPNPRYAQAMERLRTDQSGRVLLAQSRRTQQEYQLLKSVDGNLNQEVIRLAEGDEPCDRCEPLDGTMGTVAELAASGELPGGSSCEGGDNCLCQVYPVIEK